MQSFGELPCSALLAKVTKIRFQYADLPCPYPLTPSEASTPVEKKKKKNQQQKKKT
ncbi:hypothetical protein NEUTE2DRAFT_142976 [Neurospora tetrasperma FGSC 2509]|nr:hypothetical protein NEUTE2DRAFT_142976 [Neurospora tetrasperma FGSC 2509]